MTIGCIYNDLKDLNLIYLDIVNKSELPDFKVDPYTGEYAGLKNHLLRLIISTLFEALEFLEKNRELMDYDNFKKLLASAPWQIREIWQELREATLDKNAKGSKFKKLLCQIRANVTYHYFQSANVLRNSYIEFFTSRSKNKLNDYAYYSAGENMQTTRFYYADAAIDEYLSSIYVKSENFEKELLNLMDKLHVVFRYILVNNIKFRKSH